MIVVIDIINNEELNLMTRIETDIEMQLITHDGMIKFDDVLYMLLIEAIHQKIILKT